MGEMKRETGELGMIRSISLKGGHGEPRLHRLLVPASNPGWHLSSCGQRVRTLDYLIALSGMTHPWLPLTFACGSCFRGMQAYTSGVISENMVTFTTWTQKEIDAL